MLSKIPLLIYFSFVGYFLLFGFAALQYPGGSDAFPDANSYDLFHNYWCDLMGEESKNCLPNSGAVYAKIAHVISAFGLGLFSIIFPFLFEKRAKIHRYITISGVLMSIFYALILTELHDLAINLTGLSGAFVFFLAAYEMLTSKKTTVFLSFLAVVLISSFSLFIYLSQWNIYYLPFIQKIMLLSITSWMIWITWLIEKKIA